MQQFGRINFHWTKTQVTLFTSVYFHKDDSNSSLVMSDLFFITFPAAIRQTLDNWRGYCLIHPILISVYFLVRSESQTKPCNKVGTRSVAKCISGIQTMDLPILKTAHYPTVLLLTSVYRSLKLYKRFYYSISGLWFNKSSRLIF